MIYMINIRVFLLLFLISICEAGLLGDVQAPVEFFEIHVDEAHPDQIFKEFEIFAEKYKRDYKTQEEKTFRFNQFTKNHNSIGKLNDEAKKQGKNVTFAINNFADYTKEEFLGILSHSKPTKSNLPVYQNETDEAGINITKRQKRSHYERDLDLREYTVGGQSIVGPVKSQGHCGCCWAFAATAVSETAFAVNEKQFLVLSDQEICDCGTDGSNPGCIGGQPSYGLEFVHQYGQTISDNYPYVDGRANKTGRCKVRSVEAVIPPGVLHGSYIEPRHSEEYIIAHLNKYKIPVAVYFRVGKAFEFYDGGVFSETDCDDMKPTVYHSGAIIGYGTTDEGENYWVLRNSWADDWGDAGYIYVARGVNWCDIEDNAVTVRYNKHSNSRSRSRSGGRHRNYNY